MKSKFNYFIVHVKYLFSEFLYVCYFIQFYYFLNNWLLKYIENNSTLSLIYIIIGAITLNLTY